MSKPGLQRANYQWPTLSAFPIPAKALVSVIILTMALAMAGALGQSIVHDIIPTFYSDQALEDRSSHRMGDMSPDKAGAENETASDRGDLF